MQGTIFGLAPVSSTVPTRDVRDQKNRILPEPNGKTLPAPHRDQDGIENKW